MKNTHGGARPGAGAPKKKNKKIKTSVAIRPDQLEKMKENPVSAGKQIEKALDLYFWKIKKLSYNKGRII